MVNILPPRVSIADQLGMSLGQGLQQGLQQAAQTQYQRNLISDALSQAEKEIYAPPKQKVDNEGKPLFDTQKRPIYEEPTQKDYLRKVFAIMKATAGIPGSERYLGQLFEILSRQRLGQAGQSLGQPGQTGQPIQAGQPLGQEGGAISTGQQPSLIDESQNLSQEEIENRKQIYTPEQIGFRNDPRNTQFYSRGLLPKPLTTEDESLYIENARNSLGEFMSPEQVTAFARSEIENEKRSRAEKINAWEDMAQKRGVSIDELPAFMRISENYNQSPTVTEGVDRALKEFTPAVRSALDALDKIKLPGFFGRTIGGKPLVGGVVGSLLTGGKTRDQALESLVLPVRKLIDFGQENLVRPMLIAKGLSPTEIEEIIVPPRKKLKENIYNFKPGNKLNNAQQTTELTNFFLNNFTPEDSLLSIRDRLYNKGYNWINFSQALDNAISIKSSTDKPIVLSPRQNQELFEFTNKPPRQSLDSIFGNGISDFLEGKK